MTNISTRAEYIKNRGLYIYKWQRLISSCFKKLYRAIGGGAGGPVAGDPHEAESPHETADMSAVGHSRLRVTQHACLLRDTAGMSAV